MEDGREWMMRWPVGTKDLQWYPTRARPGFAPPAGVHTTLPLHAHRAPSLGEPGVCLGRLSNRSIAYCWIAECQWHQKPNIGLLDSRLLAPFPHPSSFLLPGNVTEHCIVYMVNN